MSTIKCLVDGCDRVKTAHGMCLMHYKRARRHNGDPLGRTVGETEIYLRDIVLKNKNKEDCLIWPFWRGHSGYAKRETPGRSQYVCKWLCEELFGPPPTPAHQAAHSCGRGKSGCVNIHHLSWKTPTENQADRVVHGTDGRGERHPIAKLKIKDVLEIRELCKTTTHKKIARMYGVSKGTIGHINTRRSWGWLP